MYGTFSSSKGAISEMRKAMHLVRVPFATSKVQNSWRCGLGLGAKVHGSGCKFNAILWLRFIMLQDLALRPYPKNRKP